MWNIDVIGNKKNLFTFFLGCAKFFLFLCGKIELDTLSNESSMFSNEIVSEEDKTSEHVHALELVVAKDATCTAIGWEAYAYCKECDYTTYKEIPAKGHALEKSSKVINGITIVEYNCENCDYSYGDNCKIENASQFDIDYEHYLYPTLLKTVANKETSLALSALITVSTN